MRTLTLNCIVALEEKAGTFGSVVGLIRNDFEHSKTNTKLWFARKKRARFELAQPVAETMEVPTNHPPIPFDADLFQPAKRDVLDGPSAPQPLLGYSDVDPFRFVTRQAGPILHHLEGVPILEIRSEPNRTSRTFLYLHCTNPALFGLLGLIELHSGTTEPTLIGQLEAKNGSRLVQISGFMEVVVPRRVVQTIDQRKLTSQSLNKVICLKIHTGIALPFCVFFYRDRRLHGHRAQASDAVTEEPIIDIDVDWESWINTLECA